ncbi:phenylacetate-CoA oxygenase subunit PaaC [Chryseobacterium sp. POL2]|uniref:1,2-phenylacetyl-CoA epoxidase subunit PaaC n=1 Tax=Chryseobacterium sp. POL2 TaxID=2713414 RepID=UPI0013E14F5F|nr:1,2-phenylacetyl-CoA epoxidase subunit PaaC [Chryseobacterium sp. POL2]QIG90329.1 phenylacetate-CoA oxygenase subunit PaaC [Chryseobacterium sp. POL2]
MTTNNNTIAYLLQLADTSMILGQRLSEWCGKGPVLEQDIALSNIALDLLGEASHYYQYAAEFQGEGKTEDDLAFLRNEREFRNLLLVERPNGHFGDTIARQFYFDVYHVLLLSELKNSSDINIASIAEKSLKEATYHAKWSGEWIIRLGDGTEESHAKIQKSVQDFIDYTDEMFIPTSWELELIEAGQIPDIRLLQEKWMTRVNAVLDEATLSVDVSKSRVLTGGKNGEHTEALGYILAEMQYMQRMYPGMEW